MKRSLYILLSLGVSACATPKQKSASVTPASETSSSSPVAQVNATRVAKDGLPEASFVLLDEGQSPKTQLALAPKVGERVRVRTASESVSSVFVGGQLLSKTPSPTVVTTVQAEVLASGPKEIRVDWTSAHTVEPVEGADAKEFARIKAKRDAQGSAHGVMTFNPRGQRLTSQFDRGDKELIGWDANIVMTWPEVPVGPGARWETVFKNQIDGIDCEVKTTVTLLSVSEGKAYLELDSVTQGKPGQLELPDLPKGVDVELVSMVIKLKGQYVASISGFHQQQGEMKGTREMVMKLRSQGQEQDMHSRTELSSKTTFGLP